MDVRIEPRPLSGAVSAIPSKSDAHRQLICAALADGPTELFLTDAPADGGAAPTALSADLTATMDCLTALGAGFSRQGERIAVTPIRQAPETAELDCGESGSTLRFLLPVAAALCPRVRFTGHGRLPQRPIGDLLAAMTAHGVAFSAGALPFETRGRFTGGSCALPGDVSSQYITGLLLAAPLTEAGVELTLTSPLQSAAYVDITLTALKRFGIQVERAADGWSAPGRQVFHSQGRRWVDGDWSNAAFFLTAGVLSDSGSVALLHLDDASPQGDRAVVPLLRRFRGCVQGGGDFFRACPSTLYPCEIDVSDVPDLLPVLAAAAACAKGKTRFVNAGRLRLKESDRLSATAAMLRALGGKAVEQPAGLIVRGAPRLRGGTVDGCGDHRIVMAAAAAAVRCAGPVTILGAQAVNKSYPSVWDDYKQLGGCIHVL